MNETAAANHRKVVAFRIGTQEFCVDIMSVRELRCWTPATQLPRAPDFVLGVINLRGSILPIVDLAMRFGFRATNATSRHVVIVTQIDKRTVGLLVDAVSDILSVTDELVQPTPDVLSNMADQFVRGVFIIETRMVSLIALDNIVPQAEMEAA